MIEERHVGLFFFYAPSLKKIYKKVKGTEKKNK